MTPAGWRAAYDSGVKRATADQLDLPVMTDLALEVTLLRITVNVLSSELTARDETLKKLRGFCRSIGLEPTI